MLTNTSTTPKIRFSECPSTTVSTFTEKNDSTRKVRSIGRNLHSLT